jgi:hypothetical protein
VETSKRKERTKRKNVRLKEERKRREIVRNRRIRFRVP